MKCDKCGNKLKGPIEFALKYNVVKITEENKALQNKLERIREKCESILPEYRSAICNEILEILNTERGGK